MLSYCFKRKKETEIINPKVFKVSIYGGILLLSKYVVCNSKMSRFINEQEASGLLNKLRIKTSLSEIPLLEDIFY